MIETSETVRQLIAAPPGWRVVRPMLSVSGDLSRQADDRLFYVTHVACFALVAGTDDGDTYAEVRAVTTDDFPQVLTILGPEEHLAGVICYLAPGEDIDHYVREEAIKMIEEYRTTLVVVRR